MDVAETAGGFRDVLWRYLYVALDLGSLAAQAGLRQEVTSVESPFYTYLEEMRRRVARWPGWAVPWRCSNTCRRRSLGTGGRNVPVDESPMRSRSPTFFVMMRSPRLERRACTCGQRIWRRDISLRSRGALSAMVAHCADPGGPGGGRLPGGTARPPPG